MSKVALRVYNREIEALIDQGHIDEAVAHCMHILKSFPKYLETYRLMGKAYLEGHRFSDAADIFQRVLLAAPDDFVSHLGMSIVFDEQNDLPAAIWHMERAFEINSTNGGVQSELRRLYSRRDGLEPPRIHLTRGALAQIYAKGGEFQQAISEIKSVLSEDETRSDMKNLLARCYFRAGMKNEAVELCMELLKGYPYSLDANRIMVEILPGTSMAQGVEQYKRRMRSLDPYTAATTASVFETDSLPDTAVMIERLEWDPNPRPNDNWKLPSDAVSGKPSVSIPSTPVPVTSNDEIPDWMKQSGWGPSNGDVQENQSTIDEPGSSQPAAADGLAAAEIPDWLKAMAPVGATSSVIKNSVEEEPADFDWLATLGSPGGKNPSPALQDKQPGSESIDDLDWLGNLNQTTSAETAAMDNSAPDWLTTITSPKEDEGQPADKVQHTSALPDLSQSENLNKLAVESLEEISQPNPPLTSEEIPSNQTTDSDLSWLGDITNDEPGEIQSSSIPVNTDENVPDWLRNLGEIQPTAVEPEGSPADFEVPLHVADIVDPTHSTVAPSTFKDLPDWMSEKLSKGSIQSEPTTASEAAHIEPADETVPDWLKSLAGPDVGIATNTAASTHEPEDEAMPDWLKSLSGTSDNTSVFPAENSPTLSAPDTVAQDEEAVPDWLNSLGTSADTIKPDNIPAWLDSSSDEPSQPSLAKITGNSDTEDVPDRLNKKIPEPVDTISPVEQTAAAIQPDWLDDLSKATEHPEPEQTSLQQATEQTSEADSALAWLDSLSNPQPAPVESPDENVPGWLSGLSSDEKPETEISAEGKPVQKVSGEGVPEWLNVREVGEPEVKQSSSDVVPGWLDANSEASNAQIQPESSDIPLAAIGTDGVEKDEAFQWLENLSTDEGTLPDEAVSSSEQMPDTADEWIDQVDERRMGSDTQPIINSEVQPRAEADAFGELFTPIATPDVSEAEQAEAFEWLENLVAGQASETPKTTSEISDLASAPSTNSSEQDEALKWLEFLDHEHIAVPDDAGISANLDTATPSAGVSGSTTSEPIYPDIKQDKQTVDQTTEHEDSIPGIDTPLSELVTGPGTSASDQDEALKWLESLAINQGADADELITNATKNVETPPDWVTSATQAKPASSPIEQPMVPADKTSSSQEDSIPGIDAPLSDLVSGPGTSASEQDEALKWLESLAIKQGADASELITSADQNNATPPDWVTRAGVNEPSQSSADTIEHPVDWFEETTLPSEDVPGLDVPVSELVTGSDTSSSEQDESLKWLESLSLKQGADKDELITSASRDPETIPDRISLSSSDDVTTPILKQVDSPGNQISESRETIPGIDTPLSDLVKGPGTSASEQDEALKWLESLAIKQGADAAELITSADQNSETPPDWITNSLSDGAVETTPVSKSVSSDWAENKLPSDEIISGLEEPLSDLVTGPGTTESDQDQALKWLESLAIKQGVDAGELITDAASDSETTPDWINSATNKDDHPTVLIPMSLADSGDDSLDWRDGINPSEPSIAGQSLGVQPESAPPEDALGWLHEYGTASAGRPVAGDEISGQKNFIDEITSSVEDTSPTRLSGLPLEAEKPLDDVSETRPIGKVGEAITGSDNTELPDETTPTRVSKVVSGPVEVESLANLTIEKHLALQEQQDDSLEWRQQLDAQAPSASTDEAAPPPPVDALGWLNEYGTASVDKTEPAVDQETTAKPASVVEDLDWLGELGKPIGENAGNIPDTVSEESEFWLPRSQFIFPDAPDVSSEWLIRLKREEHIRTLGLQSAEVASNVPEHEPEAVSLDDISWALQPLVPEEFDPHGASTQLSNEQLPEAPQDQFLDRSSPALLDTDETESEIPVKDQAESASVAQQTTTDENQHIEPVDLFSALEANNEADVFQTLESVKDPAVSDSPINNVSVESIQPDQSEPNDLIDSDTWFTALDASSEDDVVKPTEPLSWILETPPAGENQESLPEEKASLSDWLASLEQDSDKPVEPMPWELNEALALDAQSEDKPTSLPTVEETISDDDFAIENESIDWLADLEINKTPNVSESMPKELGETQFTPAGEQNTPVEPGAIESNSSSDLAEWLKSLEEPVDEVEWPDLDQQKPTSQDASPSWLRSIPVTQASIAGEEEELPDWLRDSPVDQTATAPSQISSEFAAQEMQSQPQGSINFDEAEKGSGIPLNEDVRTDLQEPEPEIISQPGPVIPEMTRPDLPIGDKDALAVQKARELLSRGGLDVAMNEYTRLIRKGKLLEEVIYDLQEAVYSHPVDVIVWQTLGDAYMRSNRLQEALDAYSKAEELLR